MSSVTKLKESQYQENIVEIAHNIGLVNCRPPKKFLFLRLDKLTIISSE
jgi:hypothetical protein